MPDHLLIVESPSKASTLKKFLGENFQILASYGHVRDLEAKEGAVDPEINFGMRYKLIERNKKHLKTILDAAKKSDIIYLATDPDREGEAIAWHLSEIFAEKKILPKTRLCRVVFYEITKTAVTSAVKNPREVSMDLVNAQQARRALDHLVGFNLSPLLWKKVGRNLSAGRVQSPALRLIVEREQEIEKFDKKEYWTIHFKSQIEGLEMSAKLSKLNGHKLEQFDIPTEKQQESALTEITKNTNLTVTVHNVAKKPRTRRPAAPFTTSTLQQDGIRKLGFSARETMMVAQQLYEGIAIDDNDSIGLISYMRTDSVNLSNDAINDIRNFINKEFSTEYLPNEPTNYKGKSKNAQEAHEAVRPTLISRTPESLKQYLTPTQFSLYQLIWRRTVACQMTSAKYNTTSIEFSAPNPETVFRVTGQTLLFDGYTKVYTDNQNSDEEISLPNLNVNDTLTVEKFYGEQHFTQPPPRFGEASLVKTLEEFGIGRPSTYATIITTLQDRGYAILEKKRFTPTDVGRLVNGFLLSHFDRYLEYDFTAKLEEDLDAISNGDQNWTKVMTDFWNKFALDLKNKDEVKRGIPIPNASPGVRTWEEFSKQTPFDGNGKDQESNVRVLPTTAEKCPKCNIGTLLLQNSARGLFVGCSNYPDCKYTDPFGSGPILKDPIVLGMHPEMKTTIKLLGGPYGPYVQLGDAQPDSKRKPKRASWPKDTGIPDANDKDALSLAVKLLSLPRKLGLHPETKLVIETSIGRFGPYIKHDGSFKSIPKDENPYDISLNRAIELLSQPSTGGRGGTAIGKHPDDKKPVSLHKGRYGPYVKHGKVNATVPDKFEPSDVTLEIALDLLKEKISKGDTKKPAKKRTKTRKKKA
ncbi:MAG: DNA topoisomerase I [Proteobacteria bacterium]|nr:DNA topoisomerase I [Pseudomonadota bacterium]